MVSDRDGDAMDTNSEAPSEYDMYTDATCNTSESSRGTTPEFSQETYHVPVAKSLSVMPYTTLIIDDDGNPTLTRHFRQGFNASYSARLFPFPNEAVLHPELLTEDNLVELPFTEITKRKNIIGQLAKFEGLQKLHIHEGKHYSGGMGSRALTMEETEHEMFQMWVKRAEGSAFPSITVLSEEDNIELFPSVQCGDSGYQAPDYWM